MQRTSSLTRWTLKIAMCLLVGAMVTLAVAWGCAMLGSDATPVSIRYRVSDGGSERLGFLLTGAVYEGCSLTSMEAEYVPTVEATPPSWAERPGPDEDVVTRVFGWPVRSMILHERTVASTGQTRSDGWRVRGGQNPIELPVRVMPGGFALGILGAAGVVLCAMSGGSWLRRREQAAKGQCVGCGYSRVGVAGSVACPECGKV
jgi:hypothetical protein